MSSLQREYVDLATTKAVDDFLQYVCSDKNYLCKNVDKCAKSSNIWGGKDNILKVCENIKKGEKCSKNVDTCLVSARSEIPGASTNVVTTFMNIIIPIPGSETNGNKKFLRLPPLSGSIKPGSDDTCSLCACFERFARSRPGEGNTDYTAPGQNTCIFSDNFEYYYYPLDIENIVDNLTESPDIYLGGNKVLNSNIIYSNNNEDLKPDRLYDILIDNGINETVAYDFITKVLYKNNTENEKVLNLHLTNGKLKSQVDKNKNIFLKNIVTFYLIFIAFVILVIFNLR
jgi:hypothetical protein